MKNKLELLRQQCYQDNWPENFPELVKEYLSIELDCFYGKRWLKHPVVVAPGQLTVRPEQIAEIKKAGYAGCVLKSLVGENSLGSCRMAFQRQKATYIKTVYEEEDHSGRYPIIHWDGRADTRNLKEYLTFALQARQFEERNFFVAGSFLCHLPAPSEDFQREEWQFTVQKLSQIGFSTLEVDFCPSLVKEHNLMEKKNILRWYRQVPEIIKSVEPEIAVFPKLLNLNWGLDFQLEMAEAAWKGGADGLVVANRIYDEKLHCAYGGKKLRERNLRQVKEICRWFPGLSISGTGGVYCGRDVLDYLEAGASNIQLLSFLMGKVRSPWLRKSGSKLEKVLFELYFHPEEGILPLLLQRGWKNLQRIKGDSSC